MKRLSYVGLTTYRSTDLIMCFARTHALVAGLTTVGLLALRITGILSAPSEIYHPVFSDIWMKSITASDIPVMVV